MELIIFSDNQSSESSHPPVSHHFSVFLSVLVQASRLAPVFLLVPGFRTGLESAFHLGMALPTVLEFRLELVPGVSLGDGSGISPGFGSSGVSVGVGSSVGSGVSGTSGSSVEAAFSS